MKEQEQEQEKEKEKEFTDAFEEHFKNMCISLKLEDVKLKIYDL